MKDIVIFVNLTKQCNVNCQRCFLTTENRQSNKQLSIELFEKFIKTSQIQTAEECTIIYEGGEPTLIGHEKLLLFIKKARELLPNAKQTMVSNFLNMPNWLMDITKNEFNNRIETTFAMGGKFTLDGSQEKYQSKFESSLTKAIENKINVAVNVELNKETYEKGPDELIRLIKRTGCKEWEFDLSVDFQSFIKNPKYNSYGYPVVSGTITYSEFSDYVLQFYKENKDFLIKNKIQTTIIDQAKNKFEKNMMFNVQREGSFFTINPDGSVTTNPLFSDMIPTYIGNLSIQSAESIFDSKLIKNRTRYEAIRGKQCLSCEFYRRCNGGPSHALLHDGSGECSGSKKIWEYFCN
jgi:hypothetical protein